MTESDVIFPWPGVVNRCTVDVLLHEVALLSDPAVDFEPIENITPYEKKGTKGH